MARRITLISTLCIASLLLACSGNGGGSKVKRPNQSSGDSGVDAATSDGTVKVGDQVDTNGDGKPDGVAVDTNGDGIPDGVDTNGDGTPDQPLPSSGGDGDSNADGGTYIPPDSGAIPFPVNDQGQVLCGGVPCACSDGVDNDKDGVTDLADPECVSAWDNDESSFATGISGDNRDDACQDCFFDGNSGSGNDGCRLPSSCLTDGTPSSGQGSCNKCEQPEQCVNFCKAYTPNGCDCFGCCTVRLANGTSKNVALAAGCNIDGSTLDGCTECVPNDSCVNTCGKCELCPGKTVADLPAECFTSSGGDGGTGTGGDGGTGTGGDGGSSTGGGTPGVTCDDGEQRCGSGLPACPSGSSCSFGCCVLIPTVL